MSQDQNWVAALPSKNLPPNTSELQLGGGMGEKIVTELRGKYFTAMYAGKVFTTSTAAAATIPHTLSTLASKWNLSNPLNSGVFLELVRLDYFVASATEVVNVVGITKSNLVTAGLGTNTAGVINNANINAGPASQAIYYTATTHTDTPVWYKSLLGINATAVGIPVSSYFFDGIIGLPSNNCIDVVTSTGDQANSWVDMVWCEWPSN